MISNSNYLGWLQTCFENYQLITILLTKFENLLYNNNLTLKQSIVLYRATFSPDSKQDGYHGDDGCDDPDVS